MSLHLQIGKWDKTLIHLKKIKTNKKPQTKTKKKAHTKTARVMLPAQEALI